MFSGSFHGVERKKLGFKYLPKPDFYQSDNPSSHYTIVTNDGSPLTEKFISKLKSKGTPVVVVNLKNIAIPVQQNAVHLSEHSQAGVEKLIEEIRSKFGAIGSFVHLHPKFTFKGNQFAQHFAAERDILKSVFLIAKFIKEDLNVFGESNHARFLTVSQMDGHLGKGKSGNVSVVGGGLTGLVKCLNLEWSPVFCRAVDIDPIIPNEQAAEYIFDEYHDANKDIVEVAYDEEQRKTPTETIESINEKTPIQAKINDKSVFLVSGGAKGVTATCVKAMAKVFPCKFILLGRSNINFELPDFAKSDLDERSLKGLILQDLKQKGEKASLNDVKNIYKNIVAKKEIEETLEEIRAHGNEVVYIKGDVTDVSSFKVDLKKTTDKLGKVTGIIHGAGRLADKYIQDKTETDFENVISVKLDGMLSLLAATDLHHLDYLIMFSSVAGYYGNIGQSDYAIANEILSKAAHLFKTNHPNTHVSAINWGAWDSGMVSGELKAQFEAMGVKLVNSEGGAAMFLNELNNRYDNEASTIIGGTLPTGISYLGELRTHNVVKTISAKDNPFLQDHVIQGKAVLPVVNAVGWMAQNCERLYPDYRVYEISDTRLFKGLVFDKTDEKEYTLELKEESKSEDEIRFSATVISQGKKLPIIHYKAKVMIKNRKAIPASPTFEMNRQDRIELENGKVLYTNGALFHGPNFQGIDQILSSDEKHMLLSCTAPSVSAQEQGQFPVDSVNTFFSDIQYQGMVVWVQQFNDGAKSLPLQTEKVILYKPVPFEQRMYVHIDIIESNEFKMMANCTVFDESGTVYMKTSGAAVTVSKQLQWN